MIDLLQEYDMPVFISEEQDNNIRVLLDTGANLSVFNGTQERLSSYFEDMHQTNYTTIINGFGGKTQSLPVYQIPVIQVDNVLIRNILVVCHSFDMDVDFILAGTLLKMNPFTIRLQNKQLEVMDIGRDVYCVPVHVSEMEDGSQSIHSTTVFLKNE